MTTSMHTDSEHLAGGGQPNYESTRTAAPEYYYYDDNELDDDNPNKGRRNVLYYIAIGIVSIVLIYSYFQLVLGVEPAYTRVPDLVRVQTLEQHQSPAYQDARRLVIVGDIHGKFKSLKKLLAKVDYSPETDHLVFLGDMISKGPNSLEVLDFAAEHNVSCVRGNHEDSVLHQYAALHRLPAPRVEPPSGESDSIRIHTAFVRASDKSVARKLKPSHIEYLGTCPAILDLGQVGFRNTSAVAVHAGLQWNIPRLEDQIPEVVFTMRSLLPPELTTPSEDTDGVPWSKVWSQKQKEKPRHERISVFYGHNARDGLTKHRYTAGIDTGCASGGKLTALIISRDDDGVLQHDLSSVKC